MSRGFRAETQQLHSLEAMLDPRHTALVIIDVQNDFVSSEGYMGKRLGLDMKPFQAAVPKINALIKASRERGVPVLYIREIIRRQTVLPSFLTQMGDYDTLPVREGTWGAEFYSDLLPPESDEPVIVKPSYDGFEDTNLDVTLRSLGIRTCIFTGFASNICVDTTARHAYVKGYHSVLVADASAAGSSEEHQACLAVFRGFFGPVLTTEEILAIWNRDG